jgi:uncharacterized tellurite resistance protein B-like protein
MLTALRNFFEQHLADRPQDAAANAEQRARLAAAALLVEVVRSDDQIADIERRAVLESVQRRFDLAADEARKLLELAEAESREAHDLHQFTAQINASFTPERKVRLIEELWRAAYADTVLHKYEEHLIRRVADLLHVPHSAFIAAKLRVLDLIAEQK